MVSLDAIADGLISAGAKVRPHWLRKGFFSLLFSLYSYLNRLKSIVFQFRLQAYIVSGVEKTSGENIRFLFVGRKKFLLFLNDLFFTDTPHIEHVGTLFVWKLKSFNRFFSSAIDAVFVSCDRFYQRMLQKAGLFVFPQLIDMVFDAKDSLEKIQSDFSSSAIKDIKHIKLYGYSYSICSDLKSLEQFYYRMYRPTMIGTSGRNTPVPFLYMRFFYELGYELLQVKNMEGDVVAAGLFYCTDTKLTGKYLGVLQNDEMLYVKKVVSALYYFHILLAKKRNIDVINFGACRPFVNEGLFQYKRKWGTKVERGRFFPQVYGMYVSLDSSVMRQFLLDNPFIGIAENNELVVFVFVDKKTFDEKDRKQYEELFMVPGVRTLRLIKL